MKLQKPEFLPGDKLPDGTLYVGVISDGTNTYHISIEPQNEPKEMSWYEAVKLQGCQTLQEMKLISANTKVLGLDKATEIYWSSTEFNNNLAYFERFSDGYQGFNLKSNGYSVRRIRRHLIIPPFNHLLLELNDLKAKILELERKMK